MDQKFVLGGAALPGGLKQAVARARASKGGATTFTVPTKFAVLVAALASGADPRRGRGRAGRRLARPGFVVRDLRRFFSIRFFVGGAGMRRAILLFQKFGVGAAPCAAPLS